MHLNNIPFLSIFLFVYIGQFLRKIFDSYFLSLVYRWTKHTFFWTKHTFFQYLILVTQSKWIYFHADHLYFKTNQRKQNFDFTSSVRKVNVRCFDYFYVYLISPILRTYSLNLHKLCSKNEKYIANISRNFNSKLSKT